MANKKNQQKEAEKKAKAKRTAKAAEDKTFGLKNKNKSKKVQRYVETVKRQDPELRKQDEMVKRRAAEKKAAEKAKEEAAKLLKSSIPKQKVPFGVNPKSILCEFFKVGACTRGKNCKFSHDLNIARKGEKRDLYTDDKDKDATNSEMNETTEEKMEDTMDKWDEDKLRKVIASKQKGKQPTTDKICKYFIEAVEDGKYGWFWTCPDSDPAKGIACKYRHSLPPGFVLKTKEQRRAERLAAEKQPKITLEEYIETERNQLPRNQLTPMTQETFAKWKKDHREKIQSERAKQPKRIMLTGREIVMKKFQDRFFREEEELAAEKGTEVDMSEFRKELRDIEEKEIKSIKDYGDGLNAFAEANA
ncbi:DEKNAAC103402 [Brettanomyces naardenensis]|uniref:DEKNAAC103402 n=1 Tax=Brettanomyces naardenensis TaxID=13370 RepID=A0A448YNV4_BRENA|nr:DEKNAAC103402 [Brettanomyces naardenensis]